MCASPISAFVGLDLQDTRIAVQLDFRVLSVVRARPANTFSEHGLSFSLTPVLLDLYENNLDESSIGDALAARLAETLPACPALEVLGLCENIFGTPAPRETRAGGAGSLREYHRGRRRREAG